VEQARTWRSRLDDALTRDDPTLHATSLAFRLFLVGQTKTDSMYRVQVCAEAIEQGRFRSGLSLERSRVRWCRAQAYYVQDSWAAGRGRSTAALIQQSGESSR